MNCDFQWKLYMYPRLAGDILALEEQISEEQMYISTFYSAIPINHKGMPVGNLPGDPVGTKTVDRVLPHKERLNDLIIWRNEKIGIMSEVEAFLQRLDALERSVVENRYFKRLNWDEVANQEYVPKSTVLRIHQSALKK